MSKLTVVDDERAALAAADEALFAELKAKHPGAELHVLEAEAHGARIVVKVPPLQEWQRFRALQTDEAQRANALRTLVGACVVHPGPAEFAAMVAARPGLVESFGGKLVELAGAAAGVTSRKL